MIKRRQCLVSAAALAANALAPALAANILPRSWPLPPQHRRAPRDVGGLGYHRMDDYSWFQPKDWHAVLRAPDTLDAPIKVTVKLENAYTDAMLVLSAALQQRLVERIAELDAIAGAPIENHRFGETAFSPDGRYQYRTGRGGKDRPLAVFRREIATQGIWAIRIQRRSAQHALFIAFAVWAADRKWGQVPQRPV